MNTAPPLRRITSRALLLAGVLLIAANLRAPVTGVAPLLGAIRGDLGLGTVAAGALTTLPLLAFSAISPFGALLARRYGLERALTGALLAIAAGIALRSLGAAACLYAGTWIIGMGIAAGNVLLPGLVKRDFPDKVAATTGAYALAMGVAAALASAAAVPLEHAWGWRGALGVFIVLPMAALALWTARPSTQAAHGRTAAPPSGTRTLWRSALAWQVTLFLGFNSAIYYVVIGWLPTILVDAGIQPAEAGSLHGLLQLATAVPGLAIGPLLARLRDQRAVAAGVALLSAVALLGLLAAPGLAIVWAPLLGLGGGAAIILGLAFISLRASSVGEAAALSGMAQCIGYLMAAVAPIAMGYLHDALGSWTVPLGVCVALAVLTAAMGALAGRDRRI